MEINFTLSSDVQILLLGGLLIIFGLFSMYSVSIFESFDFSRRFLGEPTNYFYFFDQVQKLVVALAVVALLYFIPLKYVKKLKYVAFAIGVILVGLLFTSLGTDLDKGARLRLEVGSGTIQPGEFFKLGFVFFMSSWLVRKKKTMDDEKFFIGFFIMVSVLLSVFLFLPDFGSLLVLGPVALIMYWYGGGRIYYVLVTLLVGIIGVILASFRFNYVQERLAYFMDSSVDTTGEGIAWQTQQSLIAVGGGGRFGKGYGKGLQKFGYIPEAQSDFIFAAFSEEIGFFGNIFLLALYFGLGRYFLTGLGGIKDQEMKVLGVGVLALILMQASINIGVNIKLIPLTGLTLPFISHGGSALLINLIEVMLLYKILHEEV